MFHKSPKVVHEFDAPTKRLPHWVINYFLPDSKVRIAWDAFIFTVIWYNSLVTPIRIFIMAGAKTPHVLISLDVVFDFIFVADTLLRFYLPYLDENTGQIVLDPYLIRTKYQESWTFWINSIACIPIIKLPLALFLSLNQQNALLTYFNVLRMIRVLHLPGQLCGLKKFRERKAPVNEAVFRMYYILFFMLLFMFECGSLYFGLSTLTVVDDICPQPEDFEGAILGKEMWVANDNVITDVMDVRVCEADPDLECSDCPQILFFTRSVYYLMQTIFTIGYGDSVVPSKSAIEMVLACAFMIFGVFAYAMTIANMTSVLANLDVVNMQFRHEMDTISHWMALRSVPNQLRQRIFSYFSYLSRSQHGMLDDVLLGELPPHLSTKLSELNIGILEKIPFFSKGRRSEEFISLVATQLKRRVYTPGAFILYQGEMQRELVILKSGKAEMYLNGVKDPVGSLLPGDYFGDYQLLFGCPNQIGVQANEFTETLVLTFDGFQKAVMQFSVTGMSASTFRESQDEGALETIERNQRSMRRLSTVAASIINGKKKSNKLINMMNGVDVVTKEFIIKPNSVIHVYWGIISIIAILYYAMDFPIRIAHYSRTNSLEPSYDPSFVIGYLFDLLFLGDIFLRSTIYAYTAHIDGKSVVVSDRTEIRHRYIQSSKFKVDLLASMPFDIISPVVGRFYILFRLPKLIRIIQIPGILSKLQDDLDVCMDVKTNETQKSILLMLIFSFLFIVWGSSGWNALRHDESGILSVYWTITTLSTVGYGDLTPSNIAETCYALFVGAVGAVFTAAVVADMTSFFHDAELSENNYEHKLKCIKRFVDRHKVSHKCAQTIVDYFSYIDEEQTGLDERVLLQHNLPDNLSTNILVHITHPMVVECEFFADCESGFIRKIMTSMEQVYYGALYMVLNRDVPSDCMYFVKKGRVDLLATDREDKVIRKLDANESFAEGCLIEKWESNPFLARTATESELWILRRSVFKKVLREFPRSRSMLKKIANRVENSRRRASVVSVLKATEKTRRKFAFYIDPHSYFLQAWFGVILAATLYSLVVVPFRVSFLENYEISAFWLSLDYFGDLLFLADFVIRGFLLAFYDENNNFVVQHKEIWAHYAKSGKVKWHVLAIIPTEVIVFFTPAICPLWKLQTWSLFRLNKLFRAIEIPHLIKRVEHSLTKAGAKVPKNPLKLIKLLLVILLLGHLNSCVFFAIANFNQHAHNGDTALQNNWANKEGLLGLTPMCPGEPVPILLVSRQYIAALYWAMATISTVGYGDITADLDSSKEVLYSILILLVGMAVYTLVIASLEDIVSQLDVTSSLYKTKTDKINTYAQTQCLPEVLKSKINSYYEQLWQRHLGIKGEKLLKYVPDYLKSDLIGDMTSPYIHVAFYIKDCSRDFIRHIVRALTLEIYLPDDYLFREGEISDTLYFLYDASVNLLTAQNVKFKTVSCCLLGESSFFLFEPHICTARAADSCEIFQLSMDAFIDALCEYELVQHFTEYLEVHHSVLEGAKASIMKTIQNLSSSKMVHFLDADDGRIKVPKGVVLPDNWIRVAWDAAALTGLLYIIVSVPTKISFTSNALGFQATKKFADIDSFMIDLMIDVFFIFDIYCRARKFAILKDGFLLATPHEFGKVYRDEESLVDIVSSIPLSTMIYISGAGGKIYGWSRLLQFLRIVRFGKYLDSIVDFINARTNFVITTASLRVCQIFLVILLLCHWCCCIFHYIGDNENAHMTWITSDDLTNEALGKRYLRSFYWSMYTITTIGYGSVPVVTIPERVFAMITMAVGAVICDAGLTAVLASIIADKDHQASTNNRRIQCSKLFMETHNIEKELQTRIFDYYTYADGEMRNIEEGQILSELSSALRCEILHHFCFEPLRECAHFDEYSDGAIVSLMRDMSPYLGVPGERLSEIGKDCHSLYIFQKGSIQQRDSTGTTTLLPEGGIIGHLATHAMIKKEGHPTHELQLQLLSANLPKSKHGNPYVVVKNAKCRCRSQIKTSRAWTETISMKVKLGSGNLKSVEAEIVVKEWRKRQNQTTIGLGRVIASVASGTRTTVCSIYDDVKGETIGSIQLQVTLLQLSDKDARASHEVTSTSMGFSHLYRLDVANDKSMREYLARSKQPSIAMRLPQPLRHDDIEQTQPNTGRRQAHENGEPLTDMNSSTSKPDEWNNPVLVSDESQEDGRSKERRRSVFFREWEHT